MKWERRLAAVAMAGAVVLAVALLRGWPAGWQEAFREGVAGVLLMAGLAWWSRRVKPAGVVAAARRSGRTDGVALALGIVGLVAGLFGILAWAPEPAESLASRVAVMWRAPEARTLAENGRPEPPARSGNWLWDEAGRRELPRRARLEPANRPEAFVQADDEGALLARRLYLEAFALEQYEDDVWSSPATHETLSAGNDGWIRFEEETEGVGHRIWLGASGSSRQPLVALQGLRAAEVEQARRDGGVATLPGGEPVNYAAVSRMRTLAEPGPADEETAVPDERFLKLEGEERLRALAVEFAGEGDIGTRLGRLRDRLRGHAAYSLTIENPGGFDPLENFLFHERRGHCELFATAGALMARAIGVPSRIAYGWAGGTYYESGKWFVFRARDAHAWTEVWLEGRGWVVMDPTPPQAIGGGRPALAAADEPVPLESDAAEGGTRSEGGIWLMLFAAVAAGVGLLGRWRSSLSVAASRGEVAELPYEQGFRRACARAGLRAEPGATLRELVSRFGEERPGFAGEMVSYHYGVRYEGKPRDRERERKLAAEVRGWSGGK